MEFFSHLLAGVEGVRRAQEDFIRSRNAAAGRGAGTGAGGEDLTEEEQLQMALAMSENEQIQREREEVEMEQELNSFELVSPNVRSSTRPASVSNPASSRPGIANVAPSDNDWALARQLQSQELQGAVKDDHRDQPPMPNFNGKIVDTSDIISQEDDAIPTALDMETDELLARQLQEQEDEVAASAEASSTTATTTSSPSTTMQPPSLSPPFTLPDPWAPPPGPLPIISDSGIAPPTQMPWFGYSIPRPHSGALSDSQLARRIQDEEDENLLLANGAPQLAPAPSTQYIENPDDALARVMEESRREAEEQERRALREQQELEYQETLLMDQIKEREREEEEKRIRRQEEEERRTLQEEEDRKAEQGAEAEAKLFSLVLKRDSEIARLQQVVPGEITADQEKTERAKGRKVCALVIRLANGSRLERKFWGDNTLLDLKNFVDLHLLQTAKQEDEQQAKQSGEESEPQEGADEALPPQSRYLPSESYSFVTTYPQKKFTDWNESLDQAGLCPRALICVQEDQPPAAAD